jgi:putative MATE family efflux protein
MQRRERLLSGPIVPTMLSLAAPSTVVMIVQIFVSLAETYFLSFLGTSALAAITLVFPVLTFMQMVANGDFGGGVASAVARALGRGAKDDADALMFHALVLGIAFGVLFSLAEWLWGRALYRFLGGGEVVLVEALTYAGIIFSGAALVWVVSLLAAGLRGSGNVLAPAVVVVAAAVIVVPLSPALIFGWGPFPRLGIAGAAIAVLAYYFTAAVGLIVFLCRGRNSLRLSFGARQIQWRLLADVLRVGGISAVRTTQSCLAILLITGAVGAFGANAIAGYGIASRLDYLIIPLLFGLGTAILTMVGANVGAEHPARAYRIAWIGTLAAAGITELIGVVFALVPGAWLGLFSHDPRVVALGSIYLRTVGPFFGFFGAGIAIFFVSQGVGRLAWPFVAASGRLAIVALVAWLVLGGRGGSLAALFAVVAVSYVGFGAISAGTFLPATWRRAGAPPVRRPHPLGTEG